MNYRYSGQDFDANRDALEIDGVVIASEQVIASAGEHDGPSLAATTPAEVAVLPNVGHPGATTE